MGNEAPHPRCPLDILMAPEESRRLDPTADGPRKARAWVYESMQLWDLDDPDGVAEMLTSELVTNAIRYAGSRQLVLRLAWELGRLRVEVEDDGTGTIGFEPPHTPHRGRL